MSHWIVLCVSHQFHCVTKNVKMISYVNVNVKIVQETSAEAITWSVCCMVANLGICILGLWRCFANNYLHWAATCTWLLLNLQGVFFI